MTSRWMRSFAVALSLLVSFAARAAEPAIPDLTGTWTGTVEGVVAGKGLRHAEKSNVPSFSKRDFTIVIDKQVGRAFSGSKASAKGKELVIGLVAEDGKTVWIVDEDVITMATFVDADTLQLLNVGAHHEHMVANQGKFTRKRTAPPAR